MEMTCPHTTAKALINQLAAHMSTCNDKINSLMERITVSTALIADFTAKASVMSAEEAASIESLANLFGSNSGLIDRIKAVVIEFKKTAFTPMIKEAESTAARAEEMKAAYNERCEAFPQLTQDVETFIQEMNAAYHAAQAKVGDLNSATEEAVAKFMALETPVVETPAPVAEVPAETIPVVVVDMPVEVTDAPAPTEPVIETPTPVADVPAETTPEVAVDTTIDVVNIPAPTEPVVETPAPATDTPAETTEVAMDAPAEITTEGLVSDTPASETTLEA